MIPEALIDEHHKLRDVLSYHPPDVDQAQSIFFDDITVLSAPVSNCIFTLQLLEIYIPMSLSC